jgi:hypothetical protein
MANDLIKRAGAESEYTPELVMELMKCRDDPVYFIRNYVYLQHPTRGKILFNLYDFQEELIRHCQSNDRVIALLARQCGKCVTGDTEITVASRPGFFKAAILKMLGVDYEFKDASNARVNTTSTDI